MSFRAPQSTSQTMSDASSPRLRSRSRPRVATFVCAEDWQSDDEIAERLQMPATEDEDDMLEDELAGSGGSVTPALSPTLPASSRRALSASQKKGIGKSFAAVEASGVKSQPSVEETPSETNIDELRLKVQELRELTLEAERRKANRQAEKKAGKEKKKREKEERATQEAAKKEGEQERAAQKAAKKRKEVEVATQKWKDRTNKKRGAEVTNKPEEAAKRQKEVRDREETERLWALAVVRAEGSTGSDEDSKERRNEHGGKGKQKAVSGGNETDVDREEEQWVMGDRELEAADQNANQVLTDITQGVSYLSHFGSMLRVHISAEAQLPGGTRANYPARAAFGLAADLIFSEHPELLDCENLQLAANHIAEMARDVRSQYKATL
jgi:hypothetical protein